MENISKQEEADGNWNGKVVKNVGPATAPFNMENLATTHTPHQPDFCSSLACGCDVKDTKELSMAQQTGAHLPLMVMVHLPESTVADKQIKGLWSNSAFTGDKFGVTSLTSVELFQNCTSVKEGSICFLKMDAIKLIENNRCINKQQEETVMFQFSCKIPFNFSPENVRE